MDKDTRQYIDRELKTMWENVSKDREIATTSRALIYNIESFFPESVELYHDGAGALLGTVMRADAPFKFNAKTIKGAICAAGDICVFCAVQEELDVGDAVRIYINRWSKETGHCFGKAVKLDKEYLRIVNSAHCNVISRIAKGLAVVNRASLDLEERLEKKRKTQ